MDSLSDPEPRRAVPEAVPHDRLQSAIEAFLLDRKASNRSARTLQFYADELRYFRTYLDSIGIHYVLDVTSSHIRAYQIELGTHRSPGGQHAAFRAIKAFLRWYDSEYEPRGWTNPITKVKPPKRPTEVLPPTPLSDIQRMLGTCKRGTFTGDRDEALILALLDTGCRASEFLALDIARIDFESGTVDILHGKGDKRRTTFLGQSSREALARYLAHRDLEPDAPLWVTSDATRLTRSGLRQIMRRRACKAGVPVPKLHGFRRTFAVSCLRNGVDLVSLQMLLGHSDLNVVKRYLYLVQDDLRRAHAQGGPVDCHRELLADAETAQEAARI